MSTLTLTPGTILQSTLSKVGVGKSYDTIYFSKGSYSTTVPLSVNSGTTITGVPEAVITVANVSASVFPAMTPVVGGTNVQNVTIENITINGNADKQTKIPLWYGPSGKGVGTRDGQGYLNNFGFKNSSGITIRNVTLSNSLGDGARISDSKNILFYNNKINGIGHDGLYVERCSNVEAYNNTIFIRVNSGLRWAASTGVSFHDNQIYRTDAYSPAYSPGIQGETTVGIPSSKISILNNLICDTLGPAVWISNFTGENATDITLNNNRILRCGQMPPSNGIPGVGGIVIDGWNGVKIGNNTIDGSYGYSILFGSYIQSSPSSNLTASVNRNIITNSVASCYQGVCTGGGIIDLTGGRYTVTTSENCLFNNHGVNFYKVVVQNAILVDPLYVGNNDYHLQSEAGHYSINSTNGYVLDKVSSPAIFADHELGCYDGTKEASVYNPPYVHLSPSDIVGNNSAVIILCNSVDEVKSLGATLCGYLTDEKMVLYTPN